MPRSTEAAFSGACLQTRKNSHTCFNTITLTESVPHADRAKAALALATKVHSKTHTHAPGSVGDEGARLGVHFADGSDLAKSVEIVLQV